MPYSECMEIIRTRVYSKRVAKLLSDKEIIVAEQEITEDPLKFPVISGTGGVRKARAARGNSGKSGGVRIIFYYITNDDMIYMLDIYAKNEQDNITEAEKRIFREIVRELKG